MESAKRSKVDYLKGEVARRSAGFMVDLCVCLKMYSMLCPPHLANLKGIMNEHDD